MMVTLVIFFCIYKFSFTATKGRALLLELKAFTYITVNLRFKSYQMLLTSYG